MHRRNFLQAGLLTATFSFPEKYFPGRICQPGNTPGWLPHHSSSRV
ncbi:hypothetical protein MRBLMN1_004076 [Chitinophaga ginsengisegetis]